MFDGVHLGHSFVVRTVCDQGRQRGLTPLLITFLTHPIASLRPGSEPTALTSAQQRSHLLQELGAERVELLDFNRIRKLKAEEFLEMLHHDYGVDVLIMGFNNRIGCDLRPASELKPRYGNVEIITLKPRPGGDDISSSAIRKAVASGRVEEAAMMLGRPYTLCGTVVSGRQLGRTIGFPTANIVPLLHNAAVPAGGVYAADISIGNNPQTQRAMVNIGTRPTVGGHHCTIEAHIIGFDGDLYGHTLNVAFLKRLRDERRFDSLDQLRSQLLADREEAMTLTQPCETRFHL